MKTTKMADRIVGLVLTGMMVIGLASCGGKKSAEALKKGKPAAESDFKIELIDGKDGVGITEYIGKPVETLVIPQTIQGLPVLSVSLSIKYNDEVNSKIKNIVYPEGAVLISEDFYGCEKLTSVILPSTLKYLFGRFTTTSDIKDTKLKFVELPEGLVLIGDAFFQNSAIESISLPKSLRVIGDSQDVYGPVFGGCDNLSEINIPEGIAACAGYKSNKNEETRTESYGEDFSDIFSGDKISASVQLQKLLKDTKCAKLSPAEMAQIRKDIQIFGNYW